MSECFPCAKGDNSGGAPGIKGVISCRMAGMGCTRKLHVNIIAVCQAHFDWLQDNYRELACDKCADLDRAVFFIDGFLGAAID